MRLQPLPPPLPPGGRSAHRRPDAGRCTTAGIWAAVSDAVRFGHVAVSDADAGRGGGGSPLRAAGAPPLGRPDGTGPGSLDLEAGWAGGHIEVGNDVLSVQDRTSDVSRYRLALGIARQVAAGAGAGVDRLVALAPTLDLWAVDGERPSAGRSGGSAGASRPAGGGELENRIGVGFSGNPIEAADIGEVVGPARTADVSRGSRAAVPDSECVRPGQAATRLPHPSQNRLSDESAVPQRAQVAAAGSLPPQVEQKTASASGRGPQERTCRGARRRRAAAERRARTL